MHQKIWIRVNTASRYYTKLSSLTILKMVKYFSACVLSVYGCWRWWKKIMPYLSIHNVIQFCLFILLCVWQIQIIKIVKENSTVLIFYAVTTYDNYTRLWLNLFRDSCGRKEARSKKILDIKGEYIRFAVNSEETVRTSIASWLFLISFCDIHPNW